MPLANDTLDLVVANEDEGAAEGAENVGGESLEHRPHPLVADNLDRAVERAVVQPLVRWLLRLHLQATADGVEGGGDEACDDGGELRDAELGGEADDALLLLVRVLLLEGIEDAEVRAAVRDDPNDRH